MNLIKGSYLYAMLLFTGFICLTLVCELRYIWHNLMVIVLCDCWKYCEYLSGERVMGFRVETRV